MANIEPISNKSVAPAEEKIHLPEGVPFIKLSKLTIAAVDDNKQMQKHCSFAPRDLNYKGSIHSSLALINAEELRKNPLNYDDTADYIAHVEILVTTTGEILKCRFFNGQNFLILGMAFNLDSKELLIITSIKEYNEKVGRFTDTTFDFQQMVDTTHITF